MRLLKLASFPVLISFLLLSACNKKEVVIINGSNTMDPGQEVPPVPVPSTATGTMTYSYNQFNHTLSYTFTWTGLTGNATAAHIHGLAGRGFAAGVLQDFSGAIAKATAGSYSGSVLVDGVVIREEDLLLGKFYINIHTAKNPGGEIRGQIEFPK